MDKEDSDDSSKSNGMPRPNGNGTTRSQQDPVSSILCFSKIQIRFFIIFQTSRLISDYETILASAGVDVKSIQKRYNLCKDDTVEQSINIDGNMSDDSRSEHQQDISKKRKLSGGL